ncbi:hypothetical protein PUN28_018108 [Cardiocondyla obscurior]|uniref:Uncharacterized protein n=1 Tax=Cardiocondyla obscurior TaxID=286306 RepID=A0AAW2EHY1_9HYME
MEVESSRRGITRASAWRGTTRRGSRRGIHHSQPTSPASQPVWATATSTTTTTAKMLRKKRGEGQRINSSIYQLLRFCTEITY